MSDTNQEQIDETIVQATEALLRDVGTHFTIEQLVRESGLSRATIYRRVGNKEALLQRISEERGIDVTASPDARQRILQAVRQVVTQYGLLNATIEQIAAAAGVGVATVYRQFGDKERLLRAFVVETTPRGAVKDIILNPSDDVAADLTAMGMIILPFLYANRDLIQLMFSANAAEQAYVQQLRAGPDRLQDRLADYFTLQLASGRLQEVGQPQELALAYFGLALSFTVLGPRYADLKLNEPERIARLIARIFVDGLGNKTTKG